MLIERLHSGINETKQRELELIFEEIFCISLIRVLVPTHVVLFH